ncbi:bifunctional hydroxymethylpyrimidine kinase/phosphomethylpyrimidine kinase [Bacteroides acidifaciens]|uniref:bifunctional hydroxymethylpyrimidine kinase/phosphomethylpyrimidine kinase n=1 Tax=Bacteroides acidifaciens TaxID=85831 RepID=UPI0030144720
MRYITVLSIAGSDCSGGAGIQADIKTISALGCYAASVITAVTVQNTCGVRNVYPLPAESVQEQMEAVAEDLQIDAVKIGMVTDRNIITAIADFLSTRHLTTVFDPVLVSSNGHPLVHPEALEVLRKRLLPQCSLITPNLPEAQILSGIPIHDTNDMERAARRILAEGCRAVLVKGGHLQGNNMTDILLTGFETSDIYRYNSSKIHTHNTHGTGCTLSSAITSFIARGSSLPEAVKLGKNFLTEALVAGQDITTGKGHGPLNHFFRPEKTMVK